MGYSLAARVPNFKFMHIEIIFRDKARGRGGEGGALVLWYFPGPFLRGSIFELQYWIFLGYVDFVEILEGHRKTDYFVGGQFYAFMIFSYSQGTK